MADVEQREDLLMDHLIDELIDEKTVNEKPAPLEQVRMVKAMIDEAEDSPIERDTTWFLVSARWIQSWARWCQSYDPDNSDEKSTFDPIDNSDIIDEDNLHMNDDLIAIRENLREQRDYFVLPENAWNLVYSWYGVQGFVIKRKAYEYARGETRIEVELAKITFSYLPAEGLEASFQISHTSNVLDMKDAFRIFMAHRHKDIELPSKLFFFFALAKDECAKYALDELCDEKSLDEVGILAPECHLFVDSKVCPEAKALVTDPLSFDQTALKPGAGLVGLRNLGNTCFMNSALQCLSNCDVLRQFFLSGEYASDVNRSNRLGTGGVLVEEFAQLIRSIWGSIPYSVVDPLSFKYALGRFEGRFLGYHQQDSQEFLSALLDRVHEDLNRIKQKPYTETPDRNGRPDSEVSKEAWDLHKSRNDSKIVDLFHGQLKSTVTCPECEQISVTFDPFMFLTLPIPTKKPRCVKVMIISDELLDETDIQVPKSNRTIGGLKEAIMKRTGNAIETHKVELVEVFNSEVYREFNDDDESISNIRPQDVIHAYVIRRDIQHVWFTFMVTGQARRLGYPLLIPCLSPLLVDRGDGEGEEKNSEMLHKSLSRFSQNPRLETDQLTIHKRKREKPSAYPFFHTFISGQFLGSFLADAHTMSDASEEDQHLLAFYHLFLARHSRLSSSPSNVIGKEEVGLYECLDLYVQEEKLSPSEAWYCSNCKEHREGAGKKLDLWSLPEVLVVHLKRFAYDSYYGHKISTPVAFPVSDLNFEGRVLSDTNPDNLHYELFAISEHYGSLGGGHYTALAKNPLDEHWYEFDDSRVSPASEDSIRRGRQSAYLLFYQRKKAAQENEVISPSKGLVDDLVSI